MVTQDSPQFSFNTYPYTRAEYFPAETGMNRAGIRTKECAGTLISLNNKMNGRFGSPILTVIYAIIKNIS